MVWHSKDMNSPFSVVSSTVSGAKNIAFKGEQITDGDYGVGVAQDIAEVCNIRFNRLAKMKAGFDLTDSEAKDFIEASENFLFN